MVRRSIRDEKKHLIQAKYPELYYSTTYATRDEKKGLILNIMEKKRNEERTIKEMVQELDKKDCVLSRVSVNLFLRELELEGRVKSKRKELGGILFFKLVN